MASNSTTTEFQPVRGSGPTAGFGNIFAKEMGDWFGTLRWIIQAVLWIAILGGFVAFVIFGVPALQRVGEEALRAQGQEVPVTPPFNALAAGLGTFFSLAGLAGAIGVIILTQDELIGEKQLGTLAWVLSKPVERPAILLAKLLANAIGIAVFVLLLPAAASYIEISLAHGAAPDLLPFLTGLLPVALTLLFYLCLSTLLGVLFNSRAPLLGVLFGVLFGGSIVSSFVPEVARVLPVSLADMGSTIALGGSLPQDATWTILATAAWSVAFIVAALAIFSRQEV